MSYIRAPRLHQSTALLCPLRIKISGALQRHQGAFLTTELELNERACEEKDSECRRWKMRELVLHVFDGAAERVGDRAVMNRLFAKTEVCQLHVAWREVAHVHMQLFTILVMHLTFIYSHVTAVQLLCLMKTHTLAVEHDVLRL